MTLWRIAPRYGPLSSLLRLLQRPPLNTSYRTRINFVPKPNGLIVLWLRTNGLVSHACPLGNMPTAEHISEAKAHLPPIAGCGVEDGYTKNKLTFVGIEADR